MFLDEEIGGGADKLMCCTESLGFESIDELRVDDQIDKIEDHDDIDKDSNNNNNDNRDDVDEDDEDEEGCCEGRRDWREFKNSFPPPLSSLNQKGQPSFVLVPVRMNGTLQLNKVRIKRPKIVYASREDGRLRLYLVPDHCNDVEEEEEEYEGDEEQEEEEELVEEDIEEEEQEEETIVESEEDEEIIRYEKEEDGVVGDWKIQNNDEGFRRCHQVVNQCRNHHHYHHHHHHNLHMYGVSIA